MFDRLASPKPHGPEGLVLEEFTFVQGRRDDEGGLVVSFGPVRPLGIVPHVGRECAVNAPAAGDEKNLLTEKL